MDYPDDDRNHRASPYSSIIAVPILIVAYLLVRVIVQRLGNAEDDYYEKNIKD